MKTMTNNLLKNLIAASVIVFTVGNDAAWGQENKSNLPPCEGVEIDKWDRCLGEHVFESGGRYKGEWRDGRINGMGIYITDDGRKFEGTWKNGERVVVNKNELQGIEFKKNPNNLPLCPVADYSKQSDDERVAKWNKCWGKYEIIKNKSFEGAVVEGEWVYGFLNGYGMHSYASGKVYVGQYKKNQLSGRGTLYFPSGSKYEGEWKDSKIDGKVVFTFSNGEKEEELWENGKLISTTANNKITSNSRHNKLEFKPSFDCGKAKSTAEKLICSDADLSALDRELSNYYYQAKLISSDKSYFKKEHEAAWLKREKECLDKQCLFNWYSLRKSHYSKIIGETNISNNKNQIINNELSNIEKERQQLVEERRKFEEEKRNREQTRNNQRINLQVTNTQANVEGDFVINIQTGTDTASLKINGEELGGRIDGNYAIKKVARAGQETKFTIVARDINGNTDSKTISVTRQVIASNTIKYAELNPALVKNQPSKDAVAIIIGIQNYKRVPKAEFANNDAQAFYDYAIRALGIKPENIKLLVDEQADEVEILSAFQNWLPVKVRKQKTDVYVYYSGHGLPSDDGNSLYILPHGADKQFIAKTAINQQEVVAALQAAQPKSVTMFIDACYSGQIRTGENLIASARPISIKSNAQLFPAEFTVITASQSDQIASSSADFKHGIFSYYLMKGMEGDADENKDNKITVGEMQSYLQDMVGRKAMSVNRKQIPQLTGDTNRVLVGR